MVGMISKRLPNISIDLGAVMSLHYQLFIQSTTNCPVTLAYGSSGTGKTTAIHCGLGLMGADEFRFFHNLLPAKAFELCLVTNVPLGYDDPDSKHGFSKLIMDLYNGARKATVSADEQQPTLTVLISSNITPIEEQRQVQI